MLVVAEIASARAAGCFGRGLASTQAVHQTAAETHFDL